jgi:hypothetical protein
VVGVQVIVNGAPAVISSPNSGCPIGLPVGSLPTGVNAAEVMAASAANMLVVVKRILIESVVFGRKSRKLKKKSDRTSVCVPKEWTN